MQTEIGVIHDDKTGFFGKGYFRFMVPLVLQNGQNLKVDILTPLPPQGDLTFM